MKRDEGGRPKPASRAWPVGLLAAAGAAGLWLWQTPGTDVPVWPAVGLLAPTAALGVVWLSRIRAARRLFAALDAYAEKEVARAERQPHTVPVLRNRALSQSNV
jgi:hypothetical protein